MKLSSEAAAVVPQYTACQRTIQRLRKDKDVPTEPTTFADIVIPPKFQQAVSGEQFLLYDNNDHEKRILIFASKEHLQLLNDSTSWHCDGTFKVSRKRKTRRPFMSYLVHRSPRNSSNRCIQFTGQCAGKVFHSCMHYCLTSKNHRTKNYFQPWIRTFRTNQHILRLTLRKEQKTPLRKSFHART